MSFCGDYNVRKFRELLRGTICWIQGFSHEKKEGLHAVLANKEVTFIPRMELPYSDNMQQSQRNWLRFNFVAWPEMKQENCAAVSDVNGKKKTIKFNNSHCSRIWATFFDTLEPWHSVKKSPFYEFQTLLQVDIYILYLIVLILSFFQRWINQWLQWNTSEFGGIDTLYVEAKRVWVPDILLYNK